MWTLLRTQLVCFHPERFTVAELQAECERMGYAGLRVELKFNTIMPKWRWYVWTDDIGGVEHR